MKMFTRQLGFTLIELIMVVVILGILSAYAMPRFADFRYEAERAAAEGGLAAVKAASAIVRAQAIIEGKTSSLREHSVMLEGAEIRLGYGYPVASDIAVAAGLDGFNVSISEDGSVATVRTMKGSCQFTYTGPTDTTARPSTSEIECQE